MYRRNFLHDFVKGDIPIPITFLTISSAIVYSAFSIMAFCSGAMPGTMAVAGHGLVRRAGGSDVASRCKEVTKVGWPLTKNAMSIIFVAFKDIDCTCPTPDSAQSCGFDDLKGSVAAQIGDNCHAVHFFHGDGPSLTLDCFLASLICVFLRSA